MNINKRDKMLEKILEKTSLIDVIIILISAFAVISFWRAVWGLMDLYLFPGNYALSLITSLSIGILILFLIAIYKGKKKR